MDEMGLNDEITTASKLLYIAAFLSFQVAK
jgi:hypothetical protein